MKKRTLLWIGLTLVLLFAAVWVTAAAVYYPRLPQRLSQHETLLLGQNRFIPGSQAAVRVLVRDTKDGSPLPNAKVSVALKPAGGGKTVEVFSGSTDSGGAAEISFTVPQVESPDQLMVVETTSTLGSDTMERSVTVSRDYRVLLTTDKPLYQPGQQIHIRALALSTFDLVPAAGAEIQVTIADGKGNKVFRKTLTTSDYGAAWVDFTLASQVNTGPYKITATLGNTTSEKTVTVENYVLPKFKVTLKTDRMYYLPGEHVTGTLDAQYFFGKPVAGGVIRLEGYTYDVEQATFFSLDGHTAEDGAFAFEFDLPGYIAGSDLDNGLGRVYLQATVMDLAQHTEISSLSLPVSGSGLVIEAIPEAGLILPGVENIIYILTSYPDGAPAPSDLVVNNLSYGGSEQLSTGAYGLAEYRLNPQGSWLDLEIQARTGTGAYTSQAFSFQGNYAEASILLRPEKPVYRVGDAMHLDLFSSIPSGTAYLDIVREGQTLSTRTVEINAGHGEAAVDLSPDLFGTLELHAYRVLPSGSIIRDTRLVVVDQAADLNVTLTPGQTSYHPGDDTSVNVQVTGQDGEGVQSALGIAVVDESVFALAEQDPGFARLYFMLEAELMQPKYDLHGFTITNLINQDLPTTDPLLTESVQGAAQAALAGSLQQTGGGGELFSLQANSHYDSLARATEMQRKFFGGFFQGLLALFVLVPAGTLGLVGANLWKNKVFVRSLILVVAILGSCLSILMLMPLGPEGQWATRFIDRLGVIFNRLNAALLPVLAVILLGGLVAWIAMLVTSIVRKERLAMWAYLLMPVFFLILPGLIYSLAYSGSSNISRVGVWLLVAIGAMPLAYLLLGSGYAWQKRGFAAVGGLLVGAMMLVAPLSLTALLSSFGMGASAPGMVDKAVFGNERDMVVEEMALPQLAPMPTMVAAGAEGGEVESPVSQTSTGAAQPPRLRQYFPETMYWLPDAVTNPDGTLLLNFPAADSITTWRMTALASTQDGRLGSTTAPLVVFQDFFIDLDLPLSLTVGDEISIPVGVFNYLAEEQTVRLEVEPSDWFELLDEPVKEMTIAANDISVVYFRIRAAGFGMQPFQVTAIGTKMSDAISKEVRVFPNGKPVQLSGSDWLTAEKPVEQAVKIPAEAIPGTQSILVKVYPGMVSQVVEGLDSILRMPYGCFEQTSSTTYPNLLVMDYLKTTGQASPEVQMQAEEYINLGYQRLLTFEVGSSGGFSLFGEEPADRMLTAYGLMEFSDMRRVHDIDEAILDRAAKWLFSQQISSGAWENDRGLVHENTWQNLGDDKLPVTAYITWSLIQAGYMDEAGTQKGLTYIKENQTSADDPYVLALVANALAAADRAKGDTTSDLTRQVLDRLAAKAVREGSGAYWQSGVATFMGSEGQTGSIETTALAVYALIQADYQPDLINAGLTYLIQQKDAFGTWNSTQATVLTLKALIANVRAGAENINAKVTLSLNGGQVKTLELTPENFDVVQMVSFSDVNVGANNVVKLEAQGEGKLMYQVVTSYYLPWDKLILYPELAPAEELVTINVQYDRTQIAVNDTVTVLVTVQLNQPGGQAESALIDLGVPPGFTVLTEDLQALVNRFLDVPPDYAFATVHRYELTPRQILIYIANLKQGMPLEFTYRLQAKYPLSVQAPASNAYDYYNPEVSGETPPQVIVVEP